MRPLAVRDCSLTHTLQLTQESLDEIAAQYKISGQNMLSEDLSTDEENKDP